jgi:hypothetical protein
MNRMVSYLFGRGDDPSEPTPLEIEYFHRYFDIDGIFTYTHPSWWKPHFASKTVGLEREAYEITAESDPAPLGSSLGWLIQLDGDRRRNEFLNSPWARICVPMRRGREREAIQWLAKHMEGEVGYNITSGPLACKLLFMASCSSHVHFFNPLDKRRKAAKSKCKFLMTGFVCATTHATMFLEQVLVKGHDPISKKGSKAVVKALNGVSDSGIVNIY